MQRPMLAVVGPSGVGKTTFLEGLIPLLQDYGLRVGVIKHHPGEFEFDRPGKDGWRLGQSGAQAVALMGHRQVALFRRLEAPPSRQEVQAMLGPVDLVLGEGFKGSDLPKLQLSRSGFPREWWAPPGYLVAVVSDEPGREGPELPLGSEGAPFFGWEETGALARRLWQWWRNETETRGAT